MVAGVVNVNQKDPTALGISSGAFLAMLGFGLAVFDNPPIYVHVALVVGLVLSGIAFIYSWVSYFMPSKAKELPILFKSINITPEDTIDAHISISERTFQAKLDSSEEIRGENIFVEYHHQYSQDGVTYKKSNTVFADLRLSSSGEQLLEVITSRRTTQALGKGFKLYNVLLNLADKTLPMTELGKFNIFDIVFSHEDYSPVKKTVWINSRGQIFQNKPESWENANT